MTFKKALLAGLGAVVLAATASLSTATPAAAAEPTTCHTWRTLEFGDSGRRAMVEPGAPWHVRLGTGATGYELFKFCFLAQLDRRVRIAIKSNASDAFLTSQPDRRVTADGSQPYVWDNWLVCALDAKWAEVSFFVDDHYLGVNSAGYLTTADDHPNGNTLWRLSEFRDFSVPPC